MAGAEVTDYTFDAFSRYDFYRRINAGLVDMTLQSRESPSERPMQRVLDLACGTGAVTQLIVEHIRQLDYPVEVIAVDQSEPALEKARNLLGDAATFVRGTAQDFSDVASNVDAVLFCNAIHLLPDKAQVVGEVRGCLTSNGVLGFNTSFYEGCYAEGTDRFYKLWMLRSLQLLKAETGMRPDRTKVQAMRWLSADDYRHILEQNGFAIEEMRTEVGMMPCSSWQDISHYDEFAAGALPGVPLDIAIPILQKTVAEAYDELGITELPRNWLQVVARAV